MLQTKNGKKSKEAKPSLGRDFETMMGINGHVHNFQFNGIFMC